MKTKNVVFILIISIMFTNNCIISAGVKVTIDSPNTSIGESVTSDTTADYTDPIIVKCVQRELLKNGYDCGGIDGSIGEKTQEQIKAYEAYKNLDVSGLITDQLIYSLGLETRIAWIQEALEKKDEYRNDITYDQLENSPDIYDGTPVTFSGEVIQIISGLEIRLAINSNNDEILYCRFPLLPTGFDYEINEGDVITIYGYADGMKGYDSLIGRIVIPYIRVILVDF